MLPDGARQYLLHGLAATPIVVDKLLQEASPAVFDHRPDPERFTLREVMAHLADWEPIWLERVEMIRSQDQPVLPGYDEGQWAIDHDYAHAIVEERQARFREGRARLLAFLGGLSPEEWERTGRHAQWGILSIEGLATLVLGHDGYHMRQISEWLCFGADR